MINIWKYLHIVLHGPLVGFPARSRSGQLLDDWNRRTTRAGVGLADAAIPDAAGDEYLAIPFFLLDCASASASRDWAKRQLQRLWANPSMGAAIHSSPV